MYESTRYVCLEVALTISLTTTSWLVVEVLLDLTPLSMTPCWHVIYVPYLVILVDSPLEESKIFIGLIISDSQSGQLFHDYDLDSGENCCTSLVCQIGAELPKSQNHRIMILFS